MRVENILCGLLATVVPLVSATALTYRVDASEKACFYADVPQKDTKVAFYFAVRGLFIKLLIFLLLTFFPPLPFVFTSNWTLELTRMCL